MNYIDSKLISQLAKIKPPRFTKGFTVFKVAPVVILVFHRKFLFFKWNTILDTFDERDDQNQFHQRDEDWKAGFVKACSLLALSEDITEDARHLIEVGNNDPEPNAVTFGWIHACNSILKMQNTEKQNNE